MCGFPPKGALQKQGCLNAILFEARWLRLGPTWCVGASRANEKVRQWSPHGGICLNRTCAFPLIPPCKKGALKATTSDVLTAVGGAQRPRCHGRARGAGCVVLVQCKACGGGEPVAVRLRPDLHWLPGLQGLGRHLGHVGLPQHTDPEVGLSL